MTNLPSWVEAIQEREKQATPGPWKTGTSYPNTPGCSPYNRVVEGRAVFDVFSEAYTVQLEQDDENTEFIAHAREDIPRLLRALEVAVGALTKIEDCTPHEDGLRLQSDEANMMLDCYAAVKQRAAKALCEIEELGEEERK